MTYDPPKIAFLILVMQKMKAFTRLKEKPYSLTTTS